MKVLLFLIVCMALTQCSGQESPQQIVRTNVGGPCEGCEAIYEYGNRLLLAADTLPEFQHNRPQMHITGVVYDRNNQPAEDIILYVYHTNREGIYPKNGNEMGWAKRHGYLQGWVKTDKSGKYDFYTFRPASYPSRNEPEHIHITVKEPEITPYYIDEYVFDDDPLLTSDKRSQLKNRGGSGIVKLQLVDGVLEAYRDIHLGHNIPNYE